MFCRNAKRLPEGDYQWTPHEGRRGPKKASGDGRAPSTFRSQEEALSLQALRADRKTGKVDS